MLFAVVWIGACIVLLLLWCVGMLLSCYVLCVVCVDVWCYCGVACCVMCCCVVVSCVVVFGVVFVCVLLFVLCYGLLR